jgi:enoyl-CoA hydratase/carnithine racemase
MANFDSYKNTRPHAKLIRSSNGLLEVVLHTTGDTLIFNGYTNEEFVDLFHQISQDAENRVVILTGAGKAFIDNIDAEGFDFYSPRGYDKIYREGKKVLLNLIGSGCRHPAQCRRQSAAYLGTPCPESR